MTAKSKLQVLDREISTVINDSIEYICITDIAKFKNPERTGDLICNWLCNRNTLEFLGIWEQLNNPFFKPVEFDGFKKQAGLNSFNLTPKQWIEQTAAIERRIKLNELAIRQMRILVKSQEISQLGWKRV